MKRFRASPDDHSLSRRRFITSAGVTITLPTFGGLETLQPGVTSSYVLHKQHRSDIKAPSPNTEDQDGYLLTSIDPPATNSHARSAVR
jgi:hypothetical protein